MDLLQQRCRPCEGGVEPLTVEEARELMASLHGDWRLGDDAAEIERSFEFAGFGRTMAFVNAAAWVATVEGHHPEMTVLYGRCSVIYRTNAIQGLSLNDFICAAKLDRLMADV